MDRLNPKYEIVGESPQIKEVLRQVEDYGPKDFSVLIEGETGTGKELVARQLHAKSERVSFVDINCSCIPQEIADSELFGHAKGSFTTALYDRQGFFEAADKGTLFFGRSR